VTFVPGENVGPYRIIEQLGQGGMATVFKAYHAGLDRYVAIKVMHPAFKQDPNFLARFQREARVVAKLDHPNIVPIYDYAEHNSNPYLVMKYIEGETLKARLSRGPLTRNEGLRTVDAVGKALAFAHGRGILHRDIKPSNILLCPDGAIYLADFGLARIAQAGESTLSSEMLLGTPHYISPEQARGERNLDAGTDIYSFGVVLYEMVVGRVPFNADTPFSIIHDHIYTPLPLPQKINPRVPDSVQRVLLKALAKERADRFASVEELAGAFLRAVSAPGSGPVQADGVDTLVGAPPPPGVSAALLPGQGAQGGTPPPTSRPAAESAGPAAPPAKPKRKRTWLWIAGGLGMSLLCLMLLIGAAGKQGADTLPPPTESPPGLAPSEQTEDAGVLAARATLAALPDDPGAHYALAEAEVKGGFPVLAAREYRKAGELFLRNKVGLQAAEAFIKAVFNTGGPDKSEAALLDLTQRASVLAGSQDPAGALVLLEDAGKVFPEWPPLPSLQAHALLGLGEIDQARELIDKALNRDSKDGLALVVQAEFLRQTGDLPGARRAAEAARATGSLPPWLSPMLDEGSSNPKTSERLSFGGEGIGPGLFTDARSIGLDGEGRIYVGEYEGGRVQVFDAQGKFVTQWYADREFPLRGMAVRRDGKVYTVQHGQIVLRDGMTGSSLGKVAYKGGDFFDDISLLADGGLLASWYKNRDDLVLFDRDGMLVLSIAGAASQQTGESELNLRVAADGQGDLLALGVFSTAVFRYDSAGHFVNRFGSAGDQPGQLSAPQSIAVDGQGRVYVGDMGGVEVFDGDGRFVQRVEVEGPAYGLTLDADGRLWVVNGMYVRQVGVIRP